MRRCLTQNATDEETLQARPPCHMLPLFFDAVLNCTFDVGPPALPQEPVAPVETPGFRTTTDGCIADGFHPPRTLPTGHARNQTLRLAS